jgi:hypothetical protein
MAASDIVQRTANFDVGAACDGEIPLVMLILLPRCPGVFGAIISVGQVRVPLSNIERAATVSRSGSRQITLLTVPILPHLCQFITYHIAKLSPSYGHHIDRHHCHKGGIPSGKELFASLGEAVV